jgi:hypothetical protein
MSDRYWLTDEQIERLQPFFPEPRQAPGSMTAGC